MEIQSDQTINLAINATKTMQQDNVRQAHSVKAETRTEDLSETSSASVKAQFNQRILETSMEVNLSAGNEPMALLFKTALEGINQALEGEFGPNAIQKAYDGGIDVSPEATADRIVKMSTAFFDKYQANHPELSQQDALNSFVQVIGGGIDKGFNEARDILSGLKVLDVGNIAENIDATYDLVQKGLKAFVENYGKGESVPGAADAGAKALQEL